MMGLVKTWHFESYFNLFFHEMERCKILIMDREGKNCVHMAHLCVIIPFDQTISQKYKKYNTQLTHNMESKIDLVPN
jgi:hypothetical protein